MMVCTYCKTRRWWFVLTARYVDGGLYLLLDIYVVVLMMPAGPTIFTKLHHAVAIAAT